MRIDMCKMADLHGRGVPEYKIVNATKHVA
jgi:hypothetical protein